MTDSTLRKTITKLTLLAIFGILVSAAACENIPFDKILDSSPLPTKTTIPSPTIPPPDSPTSPATKQLQSTETPQPSSTSATTDTPAVTPSITPTTIQSTTLITLTGMISPTLQSTSDLLFISDGDLMRWDYVTNYTSILANDVVEYSVSADGKRIALFQTTGMAANGVELFNLAVLDFDTKQITTLVDSVPRLHAVSISPDGKWLAYFSNDETNSILVRATNNPDEIIELGSCTPDEEAACKEISWSPNSREVVWSDAQGIWYYPFSYRTLNLLVENTVNVTDPNGVESEIRVGFHSLTWSPDGRFVLTKVMPSSTGVRWSGILDTRQGRFIEIEDSTEFSESCSCATWTNDGGLLVGHSGELENHTAPIIKSWKIVPTSNELLVHEETIELDYKELPEIPPEAKVSGNYFLKWLKENKDGSVEFGLTIPDTNFLPLLYSYDPYERILYQVAKLPAITKEIKWSPDGSGALLLGKNSEVFFIFSDGSGFLDLKDQLGADTHSFFWLPPAPRS